MVFLHIIYAQLLDLKSLFGICGICKKDSMCFVAAELWLFILKQEGIGHVDLQVAIPPL